MVFLFQSTAVKNSELILHILQLVFLFHPCKHSYSNHSSEHSVK